MVKYVDLIGLAIGAVGALCAILATALPYWQTGTRQILGEDYKTNYGLWSYCYNTGERVDENCGKTDDIRGDVDDALDVTRVLMILGIIFTAVPLVPVVIIPDHEKIIRLVALGLFPIGGLFLMMGMAVFENEVTEDDLDHGAAFGLSIVSWLFSWIAAGVILYSLKKKDYDIF